MSALLPCPWCRGKAQIYTPPITIGDDISDVDWMEARCTKCGASKGYARFHDHCRQSDDFKRACADVASQWNTRAQPDAVARLIEVASEAVGWFQQYADGHKAKSDAAPLGSKVSHDYRDKADRNRWRAEALNAALSSLKEQGK